MWPFSELSLSAATRLSDLANLILIMSLVAGVIATFVIVQTGNIKEAFWDKDRDQSREKVAKLNNETERLKADNLALQTAMLPRHIGIIGFNGPPKAQEWFAGIESFAATEIFIQVVADPEAQNLANEIAIALSTLGGWKPQFIDEKRSHVPASAIRDGVNISHPTGKPWTAEEPSQPWFVWSRAAETLADSLTKAGLGVGQYRVSRGGFANERPDPIFGSSALSPYFDPPISGVYIQVGSRPVAATVEWIKAGRPDELGNLPAAHFENVQPK